MAPPNNSSFSVSVVLPASGCEMIANVRRRAISRCSTEAGAPPACEPLASAVSLIVRASSDTSRPVAELDRQPGGSGPQGGRRAKSRQRWPRIHASGGAVTWSVAAALETNNEAGRTLFQGPPGHPASSRLRSTVRTRHSTKSDQLVLQNAHAYAHHMVRPSASRRCQENVTAVRYIPNESNTACGKPRNWRNPQSKRYDPACPGETIT